MTTHSDKRRNKARIIAKENGISVRQAYRRLRKSSENYEKLLTETREELRKSRVFAKERGDKLAKAAIEKNEWQKLATHLMEQLVKTKAELEVAKIPF